jgi:hypothetical protein
VQAEVGREGLVVDDVGVVVVLVGDRLASGDDGAEQRVAGDEGEVGPDQVYACYLPSFWLMRLLCSSSLSKSTLMKDRSPPSEASNAGVGMRSLHSAYMARMAWCVNR